MHHFNENLSIEFTHVFLFSFSVRSAFGWRVWVCVENVLVMMIRSLTSHAHATERSLLEANGVAQLQNVAACDSIMLKICVFCYLRLTMQRIAALFFLVYECISAELENTLRNNGKSFEISKTDIWYFVSVVCVFLFAKPHAHIMISASSRQIYTDLPPW